MFLKNYKFRIKMLELEYKFKEHELDNNYLAYQKFLQDKMYKLAEKCALDSAEYEHTYHFGIQEKQVELARLDSLIVAKEETAKNDKTVYERIIKDKDAVITMLNTTIDNLVALLSDVNSNSTVINKSK